MAASIVNKIQRTRVSSVLNKDVKQFGKKYLFDNDDETCWNSDQGKPQWIIVDFEKPLRIKSLQIQFQGGFVGKDCQLESGSIDSKDFQNIFSFSPQDSNQMQEFEVKDSPEVQSVRILFSDSTDFYGRITIYKLDIIGDET